MRNVWKEGKKLKVDKKDMLLYAVTDRAWLGKRQLWEQVEDAIRGGATFIQLREKELDSQQFLEEAIQIKKITDQYHIPFVINDDVDIAIACGADGVHVGQKDMEARSVREKLGNDKIIGVSVQTVEQAITAEKNGADYLGVGAMFPTSTKEDAADVSFDTLKAICNAVSIPVVAIGGINAKNVMQLKGSGVDGIAVVSAIFAEDNIMLATQELVDITKKMLAE
jgi:thiamine-phosphate pyrophosphorylase